MYEYIYMYIIIYIYMYMIYTSIYQGDMTQSQCDSYLWVVVLSASFFLSINNMKAYRLSIFLTSSSNGRRPKPFSHARVLRYIPYIYIYIYKYTCIYTYRYIKLMVFITTVLLLIITLLNFPSIIYYHVYLNLINMIY
jgi:hypothetical protein